MVSSIVVFCKKTGQGQLRIYTGGTYNTSEPTREHISTCEQYTLLSVLPSADQHGFPKPFPQPGHKVWGA